MFKGKKSTDSKEKTDSAFMREGFYFMEVCDQVQAVTIVLREKEVPLHLYIQPYTITAQSHDGLLRVYPLTIQVEPSSCSALEFKQEEGLSMRLQIRSNDETPPAQTPMGTIVDRLTRAIKRLQNVPCHFGCRSCGISFVDSSVRFNRVLSLPSENWEELSPSWMCCTHKANTDAKSGAQKLLSNPMVPRTTEIFVSNYYLHVNPEIVIRNNLLLYSPQWSPNENVMKLPPSNTYLIKCARCLSPLGETSLNMGEIVEVYRFLKNAVEFRAYCAPYPLPVFHSDLKLERVLAQTFLNNVKSMNAYRYILQDDSNKPVMLIKVLSVDARVRLNQAWCDDPTEGTNRGKSAFGCCGIPQRKLGKEEWELEKEPLEKIIKEGLVKKSEKLFTASIPLINRVKVALDNLRDTMPKRQAPSVVRELIPDDVWSLYLFSSDFLIVGRSCEDGPVDDASGLERVVKIMYTSATMDLGKELAPQWKKDSRVQTIKFPHDVCMEASLILATGTLCLPLSQRVAGDGFMFSMLRVE